MIHKDSGLVSSEARTVGLIAALPFIIFLFLFSFFFFPSLPSFLVFVTRCAGIELLTVKLECVSDQMLSGPSTSMSLCTPSPTPICSRCHSLHSPFSSLKSIVFFLSVSSLINSVLVYFSFQYFSFHSAPFRAVSEVVLVRAE